MFEGRYRKEQDGELPIDPRYRSISMRAATWLPNVASTSPATLQLGRGTGLDRGGEPRRQDEHRGHLTLLDQLVGSCGRCRCPGCGRIL